MLQIRTTKAMDLIKEIRQSLRLTKKEIKILNKAIKHIKKELTYLNV